MPLIKVVIINETWNKISFYDFGINHTQKTTYFSRGAYGIKGGMSYGPSMKLNHGHYQYTIHSYTNPMPYTNIDKGYGITLTPLCL